MRIFILLFFIPLHFAQAGFGDEQCGIEKESAFKELLRAEQMWLEAAKGGEYIYFLPSEESIKLKACLSKLSND